MRPAFKRRAAAAKAGVSKLISGVPHKWKPVWFCEVGEIEGGSKERAKAAGKLAKAISKKYQPCTRDNALRMLRAMQEICPKLEVREAVNFARAEVLYDTKYGVREYPNVNQITNWVRDRLEWEKKHAGGNGSEMRKRKAPFDVERAQALWEIIQKRIHMGAPRREGEVFLFDSRRAAEVKIAAATLFPEEFLYPNLPAGK